MDCPFCPAEKTNVLETRRSDTGTVERRRRCPTCGQRFTTTERITTEYLMVRKQDGSLEPFDRQKIAKAIGKSSNVFHIPQADIAAFVDRIVDGLEPEAPGVPISSDTIGRRVLQTLHDSRAVTDIARIRFAAVFLGKTSRPGGFQDAHDLANWMQQNYPRTEDATGHGQVVLKRTPGHTETFDKRKLERAVGLSAKGRGTDTHVRSLATKVALQVCERLDGQPVITSHQIATEVLACLRDLDDIAYLRFAAVSKPLRSVKDFWREVCALTRPRDG